MSPPSSGSSAMSSRAMPGPGCCATPIETAFYGWICTEAAKLPEPEITGETVVLMLEEMWHFLKKD
jgi:hypothetical protein